MAIENRSLKAGTKLFAHYKGESYGCEVVAGENGLRFRLDGGQEFTSISGAGKFVRGGKSTNGWAFWSVAGTDTSESKKPSASKSRKRDTSGSLVAA